MATAAAKAVSTKLWTTAQDCYVIVPQLRTEPALRRLNYCTITQNFWQIKTTLRISKIRQYPKQTDQDVGDARFKLVVITGVVRLQRTNFTKRLRDIEARFQRQIGVSFHHFSTQRCSILPCPVASDRYHLYHSNNSLLDFGFITAW